MNTVLRPAGPQPARVYWVRRLVLLAVLVGVVAGVWALVGRGSGDGEGGGTPPADGGAEAAQGAEGTDGAEGDAEASGTDGAPVSCGAESLTVTLAADGTDYAAGQTPTFTITFTNTGEESCVVEAGGATQSLVIASGNDRIWSSVDCTTEGDTRTLLLPPGGQDEDVVVWPRVRSDETCRDDLPEPRAGTYTAVAVLGGAQSDPVVFQLG